MNFDIFIYTNVDQDIYKGLDDRVRVRSEFRILGYIYIMIYIGVYKYIKIHVTLIMKNQIQI